MMFLRNFKNKFYPFLNASIWANNGFNFFLFIDQVNIWLSQMFYLKVSFENYSSFWQFFRSSIIIMNHLRIHSQKSHQRSTTWEAPKVQFGFNRIQSLFSLILRNHVFSKCKIFVCNKYSYLEISIFIWIIFRQISLYTLEVQRLSI